jgi:hypothetical protein
MDEALVDKLMGRVERLEQEKRRWKLIGISALIVLGLVFFGGGVVVMGTATMYHFRVRHQIMQAQVEAELAEMEARRAEEMAREARRQEERARQLQNQKDGK